MTGVCVFKIKKNPAGFAALMMAVLFYLLVKITQSVIPDSVLTLYDQYKVMLHAVDLNIQPGDIVFFSSRSQAIQEKLSVLGAEIIVINPNDDIAFDVSLGKLLTKKCNMQGDKKAAIYFLWTEDDKTSVGNLGSAVRKMKFMFNFGTVVKYDGQNAIIIDKFFRLTQKEDMINYYCELQKISENHENVVFVNSQEFSPWIGFVKTGDIYWMAHTSKREIFWKDYFVDGLPALLSYASWTGHLDSKVPWDFKNQDKSALQTIITETTPGVTGYWLDKKLSVEYPLNLYFQECPPEVKTAGSRVFRQICLKKH